MKDYLNAAEREYFLTASAAGSAIGTVLDKTDGHLPKAVAADLKRARSFLTRALKNWIGPIDEKTRKSLLKEMNQMDIQIAKGVNSK